MRVLLLKLLALCAFLLTGRSGDHPARTVLAFAQPFHDLFHPGDGLDTIKSSLDENNIQGVVNLLQSHIKQWSFIEAQLLEPNVNLGMPEIFIPLKHLTTTLQTLGSIFLMRNDLQEAKSCLERACPLMELLPAQLDGNVKADGSFFDYYDGFELDELREGGNYALSCFSLLRSVYLKMYGAGTDVSESDDENSDYKSRRRSKKYITLRADVDDSIHDAADDYEDTSTGEDALEDDSPSTYSTSIPTTAHPSPAKSRLSPASTIASTVGVDIEALIEQLRAPFQHLRSELLYLQGRDGARYDGYEEEESDDAGEGEEGEEDMVEGVVGGLRDLDGQDVGAGDHDDARGFLDEAQARSSLSSAFSPHQARILEIDRMSPLQSEPKQLADWRQHAWYSIASRFLNSLTYAELLGGASVSDELPAEGPGSSTSIISADLEIMLRRFVSEETDRGRLELLSMVLKYYQQLDVNFPYMDSSEYAANMELGLVFLDVMERVTRDGPGFIQQELAAWQDLSPRMVVFEEGVGWEMDLDSGAMDTSWFEEFSTTDRNRLLILSAFDIAASNDDGEGFDLSLGFSLGILDNDRDRRAASTASSVADGSSSATAGARKSAGAMSGRKKKATQRRQLEKVVSAALYTDPTPGPALSPALYSSASLSGVPTLEDGWTLHVVLCVMLIVCGAMLYVALARKKTSNRSATAQSRIRSVASKHKGPGTATGLSANSGSQSTTTAMAGVGNHGLPSWIVSSFNIPFAVLMAAGEDGESGDGSAFGASWLEGWQTWLGVVGDRASGLMSRLWECKMGAPDMALGGNSGPAHSGTHEVAKKRSGVAKAHGSTENQAAASSSVTANGAGGSLSSHGHYNASAVEDGSRPEALGGRYASPASPRRNHANKKSSARARESRSAASASTAAAVAAAQAAAPIAAAPAASSASASGPTKALAAGLNGSNERGRSLVRDGEAAGAGVHPTQSHQQQHQQQQSQSQQQQRRQSQPRRSRDHSAASSASTASTSSSSSSTSSSTSGDLLPHVVPDALLAAHVGVSDDLALWYDWDHVPESGEESGWTEKRKRRGKAAGQAAGAASVAQGSAMAGSGAGRPLPLPSHATPSAVAVKGAQTGAGHRRAQAPVARNHPSRTVRADSGPPSPDFKPLMSVHTQPPLSYKHAALAHTSQQANSTSSPALASHPPAHAATGGLALPPAAAAVTAAPPAAKAPSLPAPVGPPGPPAEAPASWRWGLPPSSASSPASPPGPVAPVAPVAPASGPAPSSPRSASLKPPGFDMDPPALEVIGAPNRLDAMDTGATSWFHSAAPSRVEARSLAPDDGEGEDDDLLHILDDFLHQPDPSPVLSSYTYPPTLPLGFAVTQPQRSAALGLGGGGGGGGPSSLNPAASLGVSELSPLAPAFEPARGLYMPPPPAASVAPQPPLPSAATSLFGFGGGLSLGTQAVQGLLSVPPQAFDETLFLPKDWSMDSDEFHTS